MEEDDKACVHCTEKFTKKTLWKDHMLRTHNILAFTCDLCPKTFFDQTDFIHHFDSEHKSECNRHICNYCGVSYKWFKFLTKHIKDKHQIEKLMQCADCGEEFYNSVAFKKHLRLKHSGGWKFHKCSKCHRSFTAKELVVLHDKFDHSKNGDQHFKEYAATHLNNIEDDDLLEDSKKCVKCNLHFSSSIYLMKHLKSAHNKQKYFRCCKCEDAFYNTRAGLSVHLYYEHGVPREHKCNKCRYGHTKTFVNKVRRNKENVLKERSMEVEEVLPVWAKDFSKGDVPNSVDLVGASETEISNLRNNIRCLFHVLSTVPPSKLRGNTVVDPYLQFYSARKKLSDDLRRDCRRRDVDITADNSVDMVSENDRPKRKLNCGRKPEISNGVDEVKSESVSNIAEAVSDTEDENNARTKRKRAVRSSRSKEKVVEDSKRPKRNKQGANSVKNQNDIHANGVDNTSHLQRPTRSSDRNVNVEKSKFNKKTKPTNNMVAKNDGDETPSNNSKKTVIENDCTVKKVLVNNEKCKNVENGKEDVEGQEKSIVENRRPMRNKHKSPDSLKTEIVVANGDHNKPITKRIKLSVKTIEKDINGEVTPKVVKERPKRLTKRTVKGNRNKTKDIRQTRKRKEKDAIPTTRKFICNECQTEFSRRDEIIEHINKCNFENLIQIDEIVPVTEAVKYKCDLCKTDFVDELLLLNHLTESHSSGDLNALMKQVYKCIKCGEGFRDMDALNEHMKIHDLKECDKCKKTFRDDRGLTLHKLRCHEKVYKCEKCDSEFTNSLELTKHTCGPSKDEYKDGGGNTESPVQTNICNQITEEETKHRLIKPSNKNFKLKRFYKCLKCISKFEKREILLKHIQHVHKVSINKVFKCDQCIAVFKMVDKLKQHMALKHSRSEKKLPVIRIKKSNLSTVTLQNAGKIDLLNSLISSTLNKSMHNCKICFSYFPSRELLQRHIQWEHTKNVNLHKCGQCGHVLYSVEDLEMHMNSSHSLDTIVKWKKQIANTYVNQTDV